MSARASAEDALTLSAQAMRTPQPSDGQAIGDVGGMWGRSAEAVARGLLLGRGGTHGVQPPAATRPENRSCRPLEPPTALLGSRHHEDVEPVPGRRERRYGCPVVGLRHPGCSTMTIHDEAEAVHRLYPPGPWSGRGRATRGRPLPPHHRRAATASAPAPCTAIDAGISRGTPLATYWSR